MAPEHLSSALIIALHSGLRYVYTGNIEDTRGRTTYCDKCGGPLIARKCLEITAWDLKGKTGVRLATPCARGSLTINPEIGVQNDCRYSSSLKKAIGPKWSNNGRGILSRRLPPAETSYSSRPKPLSFIFNCIQILRLPKIGIQFITEDGIGRTRNVLLLSIREYQVVGVGEIGLFGRVGAGSGAMGPAPHEPKAVKPLIRERFPLFGRNGAKCQTAPVFFGHPRNKKESVQLKKLWVFSHNPFPRVARRRDVSLPPTLKRLPHCFTKK